MNTITISIIAAIAGALVGVTAYALVRRILLKGRKEAILAEAER